MRKVLCILFCTSLLTLFAKNSYADFLSVQIPTRGIEKGNITVNGLFSSKEHNNVSITGFFLVTNGWGQAYVGPSFKVTKWFFIGISVGIEIGKDHPNFRFAINVVIPYKFFLFVGIFEANHLLFAGDTTGIWYDFRAVFSPVKWLHVGIHDRRSVGAGLHLGVTLWKLTGWVSWLFLPAEHGEIDLLRFVIGLSYNF